ncbi:MAG: cbb3-type cytochrome c oxidase subunit I [Flavobacteriales bacterium]|nr:cbb3-type cytochrome c oxidase subunit I [Flavobacteriales bacterium]
MKNNQGFPFLIAGILALGLGMLIGTLAAFQFIIPDFFELLPFFKSRPLHVSLVVSWIFLCAIGGIYYYLPTYCRLPLFSSRLVKAHFIIFIATGLAIITSYLLGKFGGREYWEFPPILSIPIIVSWVLFGVNFFKTVFRKKGKWPVYLWMWATGIVFFFITYLEANLWLIPFFGDNIVREITIQWKAYGALVGSWNMLVYGTAIFLMEMISKNSSLAKSNMSYFLYFLGLTNLMFGWAHHTYLVPSAPWIRYFAYGISMTELFILAKIIWDWKSSLSNALKFKHHIAYKFLLSSEIWIFLNLILALLISIPAINLFTHGTHITVAHSMGSTIGINSMILLASLFFIIQENSEKAIGSNVLKTGIWLANISLLVFWISLIGAGYLKGTLSFGSDLTFQEIMEKLSPYLISFGIAGICLFIGMCVILWVALTHLLALRKK